MSVNEVPDAQVERATDVLVKITSTNICGSDLHMYEGRTAMAPGRILGHENLGVIIEVGAAVDHIKVGGPRLFAIQHRLRVLRELREGSWWSTHTRTG